VKKSDWPVDFCISSIT